MSGTAQAEATFYFDLGSPYAYLSAERIQQLLGADVIWQPISLGGLFKANLRSSWGLAGDEPRREGIAEVERRARDYGLAPMRWPAVWPGNYLMAMRAASFAASVGLGREFALTAFRDAFQGGADLGVADSVLDAAARVGLERDATAAAVQAPEIKQRLRAATEAAHAQGMIGVPTVSIAGELFWGDDRLADAAALRGRH